MLERLSGLLLVSLLVVNGCSRSDTERRDIIQTLTTRTKALNTRNIMSYMSVISARYNDKGKNVYQLKENLEKNFKDFEIISFEAGTPSITIEGTSAESLCSYRMKIKVREKEITLNGTEHLRFVKESGVWKIIAGI